MESNPTVVSLMSRVQRVSPLYHAHVSFTWPMHFCHHSFWKFYHAVRQLGDAHKSIFPNSATSHGHKHSGGCHFQNELVQILLRLSVHGHRNIMPLGTSGSRRFSFILLHERTQRRIRLCHFCTLFDVVTETAIVSFRALPVGFPLPTILAVLSPDS